MTAAEPDLQRGCSEDLVRGLSALRLAVLAVLELPGLAPQPATAGPPASWVLSEAVDIQPASGPEPRHQPGACSSETDEAEAHRLIGLVELARGGDTEAFGMLYDHYHASVYRFVYYRVGSVAIAEDLTGETFLRALRSMSTFRWQGKDFGAWLTTIARNLTTDHYKAGRTRLEYATEDMSVHDAATEGPESAVLDALTNEVLLDALRGLPTEQQECLVLRFLQQRSIAETAELLGRSEGAIKQLQLRAVRNLAKRLPEGLR